MAVCSIQENIFFVKTQASQLIAIKNNKPCAYILKIYKKTEQLKKKSKMAPRSQLSSNKIRSINLYSKSYNSTLEGKNLKSMPLYHIYHRLQQKQHDQYFLFIIPGIIQHFHFVSCFTSRAHLIRYNIYHMISLSLTLYLFISISIPTSIIPIMAFPYKSSNSSCFRSNFGL